MADYRCLEEIGRGGFGVVEKVEDSSGNIYARKTFRPAPHVVPTQHDRLRKRFRREVMIQEKLGGNEIIPVVDRDLDGSSPWFVMPLADLIYDKQIELDKASGSVDIDAIADVLNSLEYLHDLGYVHRDLNPKNVLRHDDRWKLSDLGAVLPPTSNSMQLTEDTVIYTERYCAPEQRSDFHNAQASADVFSFGCILHDIFGKQPRVPYCQQSADGPVGIIIAKCTEINPARRPTIRVLRGILLETLVEIGGHCQVDDERSGEWLERIKNIDDWNDETHDDFARFFARLDIRERTDGHEREWVYSLSTPFLTRLPADALIKIIQRGDGVASAIIEKYCDWARTTAFLFHYADTVCGRLTAIFDNGDTTCKARSMTALVKLGASHNRWYVMRCALSRCLAEKLSAAESRRLEIEILTEELEGCFRRCANELEWDRSLLSPDLAKLCN